jgi:hypothetical protein
MGADNIYMGEERRTRGDHCCAELIEEKEKIVKLTEKVGKMENEISQARGSFKVVIWIAAFLIPLSFTILVKVWDIPSDVQWLKNEVSTRYGYLKKGREIQ